MAAVAAAATVVAAVAGCTVGTPDTLPDPTQSGAMPGESRGSQAQDTSSPYVYLSAPTGDPRQDFGSLYLPPGRFAPGTVPVVVLIHGGGWKSRWSLRYMSDMARALQASGLAVWNVEYRRVGSGGGWPTTFTDVAAAVDFVPRLRSTVAPELDTANVTFVGHSAGGELAAWAATRGSLPADAPGAHPVVVPKAFISLSGVLDMRRSDHQNDHVRQLMGGHQAQQPLRYALVDPIERIDPSIPAIVVHGTKDPIVPMQESVDFARAVGLAGGRAHLVELAGAGHAATVSVRSKWWPQIRSLIVKTAKYGYDAAVSGADEPTTRPPTHHSRSTRRPDILAAAPSGSEPGPR
ncbi:hypothetical protein GCM10023147_18010 [Tsukamurella soli]|uniref:BD-FAE-like domain-containing protein n=2 Tax=Tsukamurella soli TaxID=644556 RepID=A0ABP8JFY7_9ACTN